MITVDEPISVIQAREKELNPKITLEVVKMVNFGICSKSTAIMIYGLDILCSETETSI